MKQITYFTLSVILLATSSNRIIDFPKLSVYTFLQLYIYIYICFQETKFSSLCYYDRKSLKRFLNMRNT